jgi:parvulin-like peptidyl-prolyl isomerase
MFIKRIKQVKKNNKYFFNFLSIFLLLSKISFATNQTNIVAKINNVAITNQEVDKRYKMAIFLSKINVSSAQEKRIIIDQVIAKMIEEELVRQEAKNLKIEISKDEMKDAIEFVALKQKKNPTQLKLFFLKNEISFETYLQQVEAEILWSKIIAEILKPKVKISEIELKEFFEQRKINTNNKKFLISEIFIANSNNVASEVANKLTIELKNGADFNQTVKQFSQGLTADSNGEIGWVSQADIDKKIYAAISKLQKSENTDKILLSDGYHIFKVLDIKYEENVPNNEIENGNNFIFFRKIQAMSKAYLIELRKKSFIEIEKEKLNFS